MSPLVGFLVRASLHLYRLGLVRFSRRVRRLYGDEMVEAARTLLEERVARHGVVRGLVGGWRRLAGDLLRAPSPLRAAGGDGKGAGSRRGLSSIWAGTLEDLGFAWRSLRREPRFALLVVGVLGVGIALNVAVFSVVRAYLLRPLPYPEADRVVQVRPVTELSWRDADQVLEAPASWDLDAFVLVGDGRPEMVRGAWVTPTFQDLFGIRPVLGRSFTPADAEPGRPPVALISHRLWTSRFGSSRDVVGRSFRAFTSDRPDHAESFTVVGVLPREFWHVNEYTDVLAPLGEDRPVYAGRLREDVPRERAEAALTELARTRAEGLEPGSSIRLTPLGDAYADAVRPTLLSLQAAALLVLLIACANAAVLLLVRAARRAREFGVRQALGAPAVRLWRQLMGEGLLLAAGAAAVGTWAAVLLLAAFTGVLEATLLGSGIPGGAEALGVDGPVLGVTAGLVALLGVAFGVVPLGLASGGRMGARLLRSLRSGSPPTGRGLLRKGMVATEVALSVALLASAGLMVRSAAHLNATELGFRAQGLVGAELGLRQSSYPELGDRVAFYETFLDRARALPQVEEVALVGFPPYGGRATPRRVEARAAVAGEEGVIRRARVGATAVSQGYHGTMGIPLGKGRAFTPSDQAGSEPVVLVDEALARRLWPDREAVGRQLRVLDPLAGTSSDTTAWRRVVGVVGSVAHPPGSEVDGDVYLPLRQATGSWMTVMVRGREGAGRVTTALEELLGELDPELPLTGAFRMEERVERVRAPTEVLAWLLGGFSLFAGLLAVVGLYGVVAYAARQQRRGLAIRMALGADRIRVLGMLLRQGMALVVLGLAGGVPVAVLLGRILEARLHGVSPGDPLTYGAVAALLLVTASMAVWLPARRAARAEPMGVLREE